MGETLIRTYKFRLLPRKTQHVRLRAALEHTRQLYNAALEARIDCYRKTGRSISFAEQSAEVTQIRQDGSPWTWAMEAWPVRRVDQAFKAFFRRMKAGEKPGFPRFRSRDRFDTFGIACTKGWAVEGNRLKLSGVGRIGLHMHRPLPAKPKTLLIRRDGKGWVVLLTCEIKPDPAATTGCSVGVDVGISSFVALSSGETVAGFRASRKAHAETRRRARALARCRRGSANRHKAKARLHRWHERIAAARRTFLHQLSARLVRENDLIAVEDLNVRGLARGKLARDVHDAGWATFINLLSEKAEKAARTLVKVRPHGTSQTCPACGTVKAKTLKERIHRCDCGSVLDRDVAAAQVILHRAITRPSGLNLGIA